MLWWERGMDEKEDFFVDSMLVDSMLIWALSRMSFSVQLRVLREVFTKINLTFS
jgi:hypothetical protein